MPMQLGETRHSNLSMESESGKTGGLPRRASLQPRKSPAPTATVTGQEHRMASWVLNLACRNSEPGIQKQIEEETPERSPDEGPDCRTPTEALRLLQLTSWSILWAGLHCMPLAAPKW